MSQTDGSERIRAFDSPDDELAVDGGLGDDFDDDSIDGPESGVFDLGSSDANSPDPADAAADQKLDDFYAKVREVSSQMGEPIWNDEHKPIADRLAALNSFLNGIRAGAESQFPSANPDEIEDILDDSDAVNRARDLRNALRLLPLAPVAGTQSFTAGERAQRIAANAARLVQSARGFGAMPVRASRSFGGFLGGLVTRGLSKVFGRQPAPPSESLALPDILPNVEKEEPIFANTPVTEQVAPEFVVEPTPSPVYVKEGKHSGLEGKFQNLEAAQKFEIAILAAFKRLKQERPKNTDGIDKEQTAGETYARFEPMLHEAVISSGVTGKDAPRVFWNLFENEGKKRQPGQKSAARIILGMALERYFGQDPVSGFLDKGEKELFRRRSS